MKIDKIILNNYKIYYGKNILNFNASSDHNISIVSGNNGFGKTSLLTSLVWCLYGKLMVDVDERYRKEIYETGGYKKYCENTLNRLVKFGKDYEKEELKRKIGDSSIHERDYLKHQLDLLNSFSVSIVISDIFIPSIPCSHVKITRFYNIQRHQETLNICIDGRENELTKEVGSEIFINDFILPKEIAKFFFFDAEKIVSLAEIRSAEDKRNLSNAYAEVLGIKKYVDLKINLENVRSRLKRKSARQTDRDKVEKLIKDFEQKEKLIKYYEDKTRELEEDKAQRKSTSELCQEKLIREGSSITLDELNDLRIMKEHLGNETQKINQRLKELIDFAPFAIAANKMEQVRNQIEKEKFNEQENISNSFFNEKIAGIKKSFKEKNNELKLTSESESIIINIIESHLKVSDQKNDFKSLLDFNQEGQNRFFAVYDNLKKSYSKRFRELTKELKKQQSAYSIIINKLNNAESKEKDPVIQELRKDKIKLDQDITKMENEIIELKAKKISLQNEIANLSKVISELNKKIEVDDMDKSKDQLTQKLILELNEFIRQLKIKKKKSLETRLQNEINLLMHKKNFVSKVEVIIEGDMIDIELFDSRDNVINKDGLSMGERQLYATALLKALIDESSIQFPIFIDSPLQKFDRKHAENIIKEFYPNVSSQVILFPLLDGELSEKEYKWLLPKVSDSYLIKNVDSECSQFESVQPNELFNFYNKIALDVH